MRAGIVFIVVVVALLVTVALLNGAGRRPRLRGGDRPSRPPIVGWGNDSGLPRL